MELAEQLTGEIVAINKTFANYGIDAGTRPGWTTVAGASYVVYGVRMGRAERIDRIEKRLPELSEILSAKRRRRCPVRLRTMPLALEVPHPAPAPLHWKRAKLGAVPAGQMLAGRSYLERGSQDEIVNLDVLPHVLVSGMTGSGKSTLLVMLLLSLCVNTSPDDVELMLIDLKNEDLVPLRALPHVSALAVDAAGASALITRMQALKDERVASGRGPYKRVILAIDELAQLAGIPGALDRLGNSLSLGRSKNLNVIAATQKPTVAVTGSIAAANFACRLAGRVVNATEAATATSRPGTGAELLPPGGGAFLRVDDADPVRFQAYLLDNAGVDYHIDWIRERWGERSQATAIPQSAPEPVVLPQPQVIPAPLLGVFRQYDDGSGGMRRGWKNAAVTALNGGRLPNGTTFQRLGVEADRCLDEYSDRLLRLQETPDPKIIQMRRAL